MQPRTANLESTVLFSEKPYVTFIRVAQNTAVWLLVQEVMTEDKRSWGDNL